MTSLRVFDWYALTFAVVGAFVTDSAWWLIVLPAVVALDTATYLAQRRRRRR